MAYHDQIRFLTEKIQELQTAILTYHSISLLKSPSSIVQVHYVDETGCVWIAVNKPRQSLSEFDKRFHVGINYYKKGKPFFLNTYGIARVITDAEETNRLPQLLQNEMNEGKLLICVRMLEADYYEIQHKTGDTFLQRLRQALSNIFWSNNDNLRFKDQKVYA